ncbi:MAG: hypothetical protein PHC75_04775 [Burkholderiales bacterium]|nr:hypothetical protein [Burkholderiales bacterium]
MRNILCLLLTTVSFVAFASAGNSTVQDYQKVKMYNSAKDNACIWQGSTSFPVKDRIHYNEVVNMSIYYKHNENDSWKDAPFIEVKNLVGDSNGIISCQTTTKEGVFSYRSRGYIIFSDEASNTELTLKETSPKNTNPTKGDNIVTYSMGDEDSQLINGKDVVCTLNGTGNVMDYTKNTITLLCEDKQ